MAYVAPIHRSSSVRHAIKLNFLSAEEECLVVAKANCLELYTLTDDGLTLAHSKAIYGKVTMLEKLRPSSSPTDHLFVGTDRYMYFTLSWNAQKRELKTEKSYVDIADKAARDVQSGDRCLIDPTRRVMVLEVLEGVLTIVPLTHKGKKKVEAEIGNLEDPIHARIPELFIKSSTFLLRDSDKPRIALLYEDNASNMQLKIRQLNYMPAGAGEAGSVSLDESEDLEEALDPGASHLIPVAEPAYGLLILGETRITYFNDSKKKTITQNLAKATIFVAWEQVDNQRYAIADDYGNLYFLMLNCDASGSVNGWQLDHIGQTSRASTLVYLDAGLMFVGSHQGDSQLVRIGQQLEVTQTLHNIAPILDFTVMDMGNRTGEGQVSEFSSGQARIVTGSGAFNDGSLRSVRSGVGLEELGALGEMPGISNLFGVKSQPSSQFVDTLIVSFLEETRVFSFGTDGDVEEVSDFKGLSFDESTLLARNIPHGRLIQITTSTVRIVDLESGMSVAQMTPPNGKSITAGDANDRYALLSIGGQQLITLDLQADLHVHSQKELESENQAACIALPDAPDDICIVGFWRNSEVSILNVDTLEPMFQESVATDDVTVPRSVVLTSLFPDKPPTLVVAMADGNVVTYSMDPRSYLLKEKKSTILGSQQATLQVLPREDGVHNVFAICEHASLIYGAEGRIVFSAVTADKATAVCSFDAEAYPGAVAMSTTESLSLALVDKERTTHVQTLPVGETVRRIGYSPSLKAFGLGTIHRSLEGGAEIVRSNFRLADDILFKELHSYELNTDELVESVMWCQLADATGQLADRFIVGTAYLDDAQDNSIKGRIIIFEVTEERTLSIVTEHAVKGAARCLGVVDGKIVAGLIKTVVVYSLDYPGLGEAETNPKLHKAASYRISTAPVDLYVSGNTIVVADLMKSISILECNTDTSPITLTEVARHFSVLWGTATVEIDADTYLESDAEGNLMVLYRDRDRATAEDQRRLQESSSMRLGEMVNRIRRIDVPTPKSAPVIPRAFLATVEGSIYLFALIAPHCQNLLISLQQQLTNHVHAPGGVPFNQYRAFRNPVQEAADPYRFVDGDIIERFLDLPADIQEQISKNVSVGTEGISAEDLRSMVEGLRRLH